MKTFVKILVTALFLTGTLTLLHAQLGIGARVGVNIATANFEKDLTNNPDYNLGFQGGVVVEVGLLDFFAIQPEVNFVQKGLKRIELMGDAPSEHEVKTYLNYIEVPVLFKGKFGGEMVKAYLMAGPTFGYAFDGMMKIEDMPDEDVSFDNLKRAEFGLQFGAGVGVAAGPGTLFLDGRYGMGISDINDLKDSPYGEWRNDGFNIGIGYIFTIAN